MPYERLLGFLVVMCQKTVIATCCSDICLYYFTRKMSYVALTTVISRCTCTYLVLVYMSPVHLVLGVTLALHTVDGVLVYC